MSWMRDLIEKKFRETPAKKEVEEAVKTNTRLAEDHGAKALRAITVAERALAEMKKVAPRES